MLEDIAIVTGAKYFAKDLAMELKDGEIEDLGHANRVVVKKVTQLSSAVQATRKD